VRIAGSTAPSRGETQLEWSAGAQHYFGPMRVAPVGSLSGETMLA
jgi:hypothetical protein